MHEVAIVAEVLGIAIEHARRVGAREICCIEMRVGTLSGVVRESLEFAFEALKLQTMAAQATLAIEMVAVVARCEQCGLQFEPQDIFYACPSCGALGGEVHRGKELEVVAVEIVRDE